MNLQTVKFLNKLKNASLANLLSVSFSYNHLILKLLPFLYKEGAILSYTFIYDEEFRNKKVKIYLRYAFSKGILCNLRLFSIPSKEEFFSYTEICRFTSKKVVYVFFNG